MNEDFRRRLWRDAVVAALEGSGAVGTAHGIDPIKFADTAAKIADEVVEEYDQRFKDDAKGGDVP